MDQIPEMLRRIAVLETKMDDLRDRMAVTQEWRRAQEEQHRQNHRLQTTVLAGVVLMLVTQGAHLLGWIR